VQNLEFKINPEVYLAQMLQQTAASLAELRNTLRALDDGSFAQRAATPRPDAIVSFRVDNPRAIDQDAVHRACSSCFLGLIRALITLMDRIVAVKRCIAQPITIPSAVSNIEDLQTFLANELEKTYTNVARDTRLTNPVKLRSLGIASDFINNVALSYFSLRRCLEHHNGIPDQDIHVLYSRLTFLAGDEEITKLPFVAKEGASVTLKLDDSERVFVAGEEIQLTEQDIEQIFFTIQSVIGPQVRLAVDAP
jgi:hypothetical protein